MLFKTNLFKLGAGDQLLIWSVRTIEAEVIREYGQFGGKMQKEIETAFPKNVGKSNETTAEEQAKIIANTYYNQKLDSGYKAVEYVSINTGGSEFQEFRLDLGNRRHIAALVRHLTDLKGTDASGNISPMLADDLINRKSNTLKPKYVDLINNGVYVQPKFDGVRCIVTVTKKTDESKDIVQSITNTNLSLFDKPRTKKSKYNVTLTSRKGKDYTKGLEFLAEDIAEYLKEGVFDGELYIHGEPLEKILSVVKAPHNYPELRNQLIFVCFDKVDEYKTFTERFIRDLYHPLVMAPFEIGFSKSIADINLVSDHLGISYTGFIDYNTFDKYEGYNPTVFKLLDEVVHTGFVNKGFEGIMIRKPNSVYYPGPSRSHDGLLKFKKFITEEFEITGGLWKKRDYVFVCKCGTATFMVVPPGTKKDIENYADNIKNIIGKHLTVRFFAYTSYGIPRFPVSVAIRDYE